MQKKMVVLLAVALMAFPAAGFAAMAGANTVNSAAIVDGSIATADIANGAVTGAKIANGTITATQIAGGAITATQLATGSVTATQIAAGAVTDAKITGPISVGKLPVGITSTTVAAGNHTHDLTYAKKYAKVAVVAQNSTGDYASPVTAMGNLGTWCGTPSVSNLCQIKVMPGVYDLGTTPLIMQPFVHLEGSGDASVITSQVINDTNDCYSGTIIMASNSTVRNIRITNTGTGNVDGMTVSVVFQGAASTLESVSVINGSDTMTGSNHSTAVCAQNASNATLNNVYLEARGGGLTWGHTVVLNSGTTMNINNATIKAVSTSSTRPIDCNDHTGISVSRANLTITNSYLESSDNGSATQVDMIIADDCKAVDIVNSKLVYDSSSPNVGNLVRYSDNTGDVKFINSQIFRKNGAFSIQSGAIVCANTLIPGGLSAFADLTNAKIVNCYDEIYTPIPNKP